MESRLYTHADASLAEVGGALRQLADWLASYPMMDHAELGRSGMVCPFVKQAARIETLRLAVSHAGPEDEAAIFAEMRSSFADLARMPAPRGKGRLRTIVVGFPNCVGADGIATLERVYRRHKYYTLMRATMIAFFHPDAKTHGLWNPDFRSMRAPLPVLAVRYLVEQDAVFAARHKLMTVPYLLRFGPAGLQRLLAHWRRRAELTGDT